MKSHPEIGLEIATTLGITDKRILNAISQHHEKMDGSGYPFHLKSNQISEFAKIISICDIFDTLTTKRSYKESMTTFESIKLMKSEMAVKIDLNILNSFILMFKSS